jgi:signal transduction histidine kinase
MRRDLLLALGLIVAGAVEVALGPEEGRLVRALAIPVGTLPLAWRRTHPLLAVTAASVAFGAQAVLADLLDGHPVVPLVVIVLAVYSAGRYSDTPFGLAYSVLAGVALAVVRIAFDPAVDGAADVALTLVVGQLPLLVGRWARGQELLRRELAAKAARLERERRRDAREAARDERMRIAADLQAAASGTLEAIAREVRDVRLDSADAREAFARIAAGARHALADVRRVLGILRHQEPEPAAPPAQTAPHPGRAPLPEWLLPAALLAGAAVELQLRFGGPAAALSAILIAAPLLVRVRAPLIAAAGVLAAVAFQSLALGPEAFPVSSIVAVVCAAYAIGAYSQAAVAGLIAFAAGDLLHAVLVHPDAIAPALIGGVVVPWTVGRVRRGQQLLTREAAEKAAASERARERDAREAAAAERVRVARELHDAVAHNLSVVAIQAAGAEGIVERDPARAGQVLALIGEVVAEALAELGRLADDREPHVGLAGVDALAQRAREGGLPVELHVEGDPAPLPAGVDLAAFRIVQEALANTSKHAGAARARVTVRYRPRAVELEIDDDGRGATGTSDSGHGLVGMRERVALYDGTLEVGRRAGGGFGVHARLPIGET